MAMSFTPLDAAYPADFIEVVWQKEGGEGWLRLVNNDGDRVIMGLSTVLPPSLLRQPQLAGGINFSALSASGGCFAVPERHMVHHKAEERLVINEEFLGVTC